LILLKLLLKFTHFLVPFGEAFFGLRTSHPFGQGPEAGTISDKEIKLSVAIPIRETRITVISDGERLVALHHAFALPRKFALPLTGLMIKNSPSGPSKRSVFRIQPQPPYVAKALTPQPNYFISG
jgi:hypothetical protein